MVATLASQASQYARNQDEQRLALAQQDQAARIGGGVQASLDAQQHELDAYDLARRQQDLDQQQQGGGAMQPAFSGFTENTPGGATVYHPAGEIPSPGSNNYYGGGGGAGGGGAVGSGGKAYDGLLNNAFMHPMQRTLMGYVDQMEQGGHLDPAEAIRYRAIIASGGNPFEKPTLNEEIRKGAQTKGELTPYQQAQLGLGQERVQLDQQRQQYSQKRNAIASELQGLRTDMKGAAGLTLSPEDKKKKQDRVDELTQQLLDLGEGPTESKPGVLDFLQKVISGQGTTTTPSGAGKPGADVGAGARVLWQGNQLVNAPAAAASTAAASTANKPIPRAQLRSYLKNNGNDVQAAKDAARADGYDPDKVI